MQNRNWLVSAFLITIVALGMGFGVTGLADDAVVGTENSAPVVAPESKPAEVKPTEIAPKTKIGKDSKKMRRHHKNGEKKAAPVAQAPASN